MGVVGLPDVSGFCLKDFLNYELVPGTWVTETQMGLAWRVGLGLSDVLSFCNATTWPSGLIPGALVAEFRWAWCGT